MKLNWLLIILLAFSTIRTMEPDQSTRKKASNVMALKEIILKNIALHVKTMLETGNGLTWFKSEILPVELAAEIPLALARYESAFAWKTIPYSCKQIPLEHTKAVFIHGNNYIVPPSNQEHDNLTKELEVYELQSDRYLGKVDKQSIAETGRVCFAGNFMATYFFDSKLMRISNLANQELIFETTADDNIRSYMISADGKYLFYGLTDGKVKIIEMQNPNNYSFIDAHTAEITEIEVSHNGETIVIGSENTCTIWQLDPYGENIQYNKILSPDIRRYLHNIALTANGRYLILIDDEEIGVKGQLRIFDVVKKICLYSSKINMCNAAKIISKGNQLFFVPEGLTNWLGNERDFNLVSLSIMNACTGENIKTLQTAELAKSIDTEIKINFDEFTITQDNNSILFFDYYQQQVFQVALDLKATLEETIPSIKNTKDKGFTASCLLS